MNDGMDHTYCTSINIDLKTFLLLRADTSTELYLVLLCVLTNHLGLPFKPSMRQLRSLASISHVAGLLFCVLTVLFHLPVVLLCKKLNWKDSTFFSVAP